MGAAAEAGPPPMRRQPALAPPPHLLTNLLLACLLVAAGCGAASFSLGLWPQLGPPDNHHLGTVLASSDAAGGGAGDVAAAQAAPAQQRDSSSGGSSTACDWQAYLASQLADPRPGPAGSPAASRLPATLRYKAASGLCNQLYAHLAALAIAQHLGAQVLVLPPARSRETFLRLHGWSLEPLESLLDTERMAAHWRSRGLRLEMGPMGQDAELRASASGCTVVDGLQLTNTRRTLDNITQHLIERAQAVLGPALRDGRQPPCVDIWLGETLKSVDGARAMPGITEAARGLLFSPRVAALADSIVEQVGRPFVAVHLRIEADWRRWGYDPFDDYLATLKRAGFTRKSKVYAASGIFGYEMKPTIEKVVNKLKEAGVVGTLAYKEQLLSRAERKAYHSEQLALADLLILTHADMVVGHCNSSFSWFVRELRALQGRPRHTFHFADSGCAGLSGATAPSNWREFAPY